MKNKIILLCFLVLNQMVTYGQGVKRATNLIIIIDNEVVIGSIANFKIKDGSLGAKDISSTYMPGRLTLYFKDSSEMSQFDSTKHVSITFNNYFYNHGQYKINSYNVSVNRQWLDEAYFIIKIYDTNISPYKNKYFPLKGMNYTYEFDKPSGSILQVRKGGSK